MRASTLSNGFALFSMFFGAGNITFPLVLGLAASNNLPLALVGFIITAVLIPFSGLISIAFSDGKYTTFFQQIGKYPGLFVTIFLVALLGPCAGIPRCITLTYSTLHVVFPALSLPVFNAAFCVVLYFLSVQKNKIVEIIGSYLSPVLLALLVLIIIKGVFFTSTSPQEVSGCNNSFVYGLFEGYNTMDLLASFFFSSLVCSRVKSGHTSKKTFLLSMLQASGIGALLLALIYVGFSFVAAKNAAALAHVSPEELLGHIGTLVLGNFAGMVVCLAVALTCLTTVIALTSISASFIQETVFRSKISYKVSVILILCISLFVATLGFSGIIQVCLPVLTILYPSLVLFCLLSIVRNVYKMGPYARHEKLSY